MNWTTFIKQQLQLLPASNQSILNVNADPRTHGRLHCIASRNTTTKLISRSVGDG